MKKIMYFIPLFLLVGICIIIGLVYLIAPVFTINFFMGLWCGVKAPVVLVLNLFGNNFDFYHNIINSNISDFGFVLGILVWSSPTACHSYCNKN